jgi:hypothetical protein
MSDDDLWRPKESASHDSAGQPAEQAQQPGEQPDDLDLTQPITGSSAAPGETPSGASPTPPTPPPSPGSSYPPSGPGAVPPPQNPFDTGRPGPYGAPPSGPYGGQPPPQNPYGQNPYGQNPYGQNPYAPPPNPYPQPGSYDQYAAPQPYGPGYPPYVGALPDHPSATTAMVLGIIGLAGLLFCGGITLVLSPFAWAIGGKAVREIDAEPGRYGGRDKAQGGRVMGIIGTVLLMLGVLLVVFLVAVGLSVGSSSQPTPVLPNPSVQSG